MIKSKLATAEDFNDYLILKTDENNVIWSGHSAPPDRDKLWEWFIENINRDERLFFLFYDEEFYDEPVGYLYMDTVGDSMTQLTPDMVLIVNVVVKDMARKLFLLL